MPGDQRCQRNLLEAIYIFQRNRGPPHCQPTIGKPLRTAIGPWHFLAELCGWGRSAECVVHRRCAGPWTGSRPMRSAGSPGSNTVIPVTDGRPLWNLLAPAQLTASLPHTGAGRSVTTASVSQWAKHSPHRGSWWWRTRITSPGSRSQVGTCSPIIKLPSEVAPVSLHLQDAHGSAADYRRRGKDPANVSSRGGATSVGAQVFRTPDTRNPS